jgi:hypothetical protein
MISKTGIRKRILSIHFAGGLLASLSHPVHAQTPGTLEIVAGDPNCLDIPLDPLRVPLRPRDFISDASGNFFILDSGHNSIKKIDTQGHLINIVNKTGGSYLREDAAGNFYLDGENTILKVAPNDDVTALASLPYGISLAVTAEA